MSLIAVEFEDATHGRVRIVQHEDSITSPVTVETMTQDAMGVDKWGIPFTSSTQEWDVLICRGLLALADRRRQARV